MPAPGHAQVTFLSPSNTQQVYIVHMGTQQLVATAFIQQRMSVSLPPGSHQFLLVSRRSVEVIQANVAPGRQYYVLVRFLAVPFGPDFGVTPLSPRVQEWASLQSFLASTNDYELEPVDPSAVDRAVRRLNRRMLEGQQHWGSLDAQGQAERTLLAQDGMPFGT